MTVTGALFRRERENPGPRLQLSSDAAEALGILAGQPTEIKVTALRRESDVAETPEVAEADASAADRAVAEAEGSADAGDAAAIASAALAAVEGQDPATAGHATAAADGSAVPAEGAVAAADAGDAAGVEAPPRKKTWKERRAEAKAAREAKRLAAAEAKAAAKAAAAAAAGEGAEAATATAETAAVSAIESAPLDARKPDISPRADKAPEDASGNEAVAAAPATVETAPEPAAEPAPAPVVASGSARPIQVASFSKEDNAKRAAEALAKIGITATPQKSDQGGKAVWGVVVMGDDVMLKKIKDAGFADAYYLK